MERLLDPKILLRESKLRKQLTLETPAIFHEKRCTRKSTEGKVKNDKELFPGLRSNQDLTNICPSGSQNCYAQGHLCIFSFFPFKNKTIYSSYPKPVPHCMFSIAGGDRQMEQNGTQRAVLEEKHPKNHIQAQT